MIKKENNTISTVVFISNYFNHHQKPFCDAMYSMIGDGFRFIATKRIGKERINLGYKSCTAPYVIEAKNAELKKECMRIVKESDVVISGSVQEEYLSERKKDGNLIFRYSERPLKNGLEPLKYIPRFIKWHYLNPIGKPIYMLCASAYTATDYAKFGLFKNRCFKWGYFPECKIYDDVNVLIEQKKKNSILWCGRFIDWKHPDDAISIAKRLKADGYEFSLNFIGAGEMEVKLSKMIIDEGLLNNVKILGSMSPEKVREYMEQSEIFLFTSDREEGWGAVLNEAMNSACAVVASDAAGATGFLVKSGDNGITFKSQNLEELYRAVKKLLDDKSVCKEMAIQAYYTISEEWNAKIAAERLIQLVNNNMIANCEKGPCSTADLI